MSTWMQFRKPLEMRLHLTLPELEQGWSIQGPASAERILDLETMASKRYPIAIAPIRDHDHRIISAVLLDAYPEPYRTSHTIKVTYRPFWCKTFTLCAARKDSILALIMEFDDGQYWIDQKGWRECDLTLDGPGTDPKTVYNSQFMLGELLANYPWPDLLYTVNKLIRKKYLLCQEEERKKDAILT
jgi:hypothetical protein